jgi:hypothetical protein
MMNVCPPAIIIWLMGANLQVYEYLQYRCIRFLWVFAYLCFCFVLVLYLKQQRTKQGEPSKK